jgi:hypothetical protein
MKRSPQLHLMGKLWLGLLGAILPLQVASAQEKTTVPPGTPVTITVTPGTPPAPPVSITLFERHGHVTPSKDKCTHTGGGLIDVSSPSADTIVVTMSGVALATSEMKFDLQQVFEVSFDDPKVKKAKFTVEGRVIGLLRGERKGGAEYSDACAHLSAGPTEAVSVCVSPHSIADCDSLAINDHDGPKSVPAAAGKYVLVQTFRIAAYGGHWLSKKASAEFAPDPALDPLWISYWEPFHGIKKDTFGFQVTIKVAPDTEGGNGEKKEEKKPEEVKPPPKEEKKEAVRYYRMPQ